MIADSTGLDRVLGGPARTKLEQVARALLNSVDMEQIHVGGRGSFPVVSIDGRLDFMAMARAAIEAMEPTEAMLRRQRVRRWLASPK